MEVTWTTPSNCARYAEPVACTVEAKVDNGIVSQRRGLPPEPFPGPACS